ncbi:MAG: translation initiation factor IF-2 [Nanoarchaeota archaeon]
MKQISNLRSPIVTVCGHVDHGKTSILDCFRGSSIQKGEAGGITQKISFTKYPSEQIKKECSLIEESGIKLEIPGLLFIDTPGHAAFVNLRKRGGALADLAIVVVSIKEGIKPQTAEVLQILRAHKTPFIIALNKIDNISGWRKQNKNINESIKEQAEHTKQEFEEHLLTFQSSLKEQGFNSELYFNVSDFSKQVAIIPCSAKTKEGISELLFALCGLCQKFLKVKLETSEEAKGVILELKKEKGIEWAEAILYDGKLDEGDEIVIANFGEPIISKVRSLSEIMPLVMKFNSVKHLHAATGARIQLTNKEGILAGMPFQEVKTKAGLEKVKLQFKKDISYIMKLDKEGIIVKADSLGSLEALITLLKHEKIQIVKAGIGPINKNDIISTKANISINPLNAVLLGFNVELEEGIEISPDIKIIRNDVVYKLIEELQTWRKQREEEIIKGKMLGLATICKIEILSQHIFRNSNPAIFGVKILGGKIKTGIPLIDEKGEYVARVKSLQKEKGSINEAKEGDELAIALPGIAFDRRLKEIKYLYSDISEFHFKQFRKNKELLSGKEKRILDEIESLKQKAFS